VDGCGVKVTDRFKCNEMTDLETDDIITTMQQIRFRCYGHISTEDAND